MLIQKADSKAISRSQIGRRPGPWRESWKQSRQQIITLLVSELSSRSSYSRFFRAGHLKPFGLSELFPNKILAFDSTPHAQEAARSCSFSTCFKCLPTHTSQHGLRFTADLTEASVDSPGHWLQAQSLQAAPRVGSRSCHGSKGH